MAKEKKTEKVEKTEEQVALEKILKRNLAETENIENIEIFSIGSLQKIYQKMIDDYTEDLKAKDLSVEELEKEEQRIVEKANKWDDELSKKTYKLLEDVEWNGKKITRKQIGQKIRAILDKYECEYRYTLGMWQMAAWWYNPKSTIEFSMLDSTLRVLGNSGIKFKGPQEWENILTINEYFRQSNDEYTRDTLHTIFLAERHNAIVDELTLKKPQIVNEDKDAPEMKEAKAPEQGNIEMVEE